MYDHELATTEIDERHDRADAARLAAGVPRTTVRHALAGRLHRLADRLDDRLDDCRETLTEQVRSASRPHASSTP